MSWDEKAFAFVFDTARAWLGREPPEVLERRIELAPLSERFKTLAALISGVPLEVRFVDEPSGHRGDELLLPCKVDSGPTQAHNLSQAIVRLAWAATSWQLGFTLPDALPPNSPEALLATALASKATRTRLLEELPAIEPALRALEHDELARRPTHLDVVEAVVQLALGAPHSEPAPHQVQQARTLWHDAPTTPGALAPLLGLARNSRTAAVPVALWGCLRPAAPSRRNKSISLTNQADALPSGTEKKKKETSSIRRVDEPENQLAENPLVHSFEKVHTLEPYRGGQKRIDGDDELEAHAKALDELDLREVIRSHRRAKSVYQADLGADATVADLDAATDADAKDFHYDEWDERHRSWKKEWCRLSTHSVNVTPDADARVADLRRTMARTTTGLRAVFEQLEAARCPRPRQNDGPDVDIDALISRHASLKAGHEGPTRLYISRRRHTRDTAVLILLDASLSTDAWVANRRVIDIEREAIIALGDALDGLLDEVCVAAFSSQTRHDCRWLLAKGFRDSWREGARRIASLEPHGFTRIGPSLRHATHLLHESGARKKLLLVVSDGKPSDLDRYEGRYGVADIHRAVLDAEAVGVSCHALAVDPASRSWLPSMFGQGNASVVDRPAQLVEVMAKVTSNALR